MSLYRDDRKYMVSVDGRGAPAKVYDTKDEALAQAKKLAVKRAPNKVRVLIVDDMVAMVDNEVKRVTEDHQPRKITGIMAKRMVLLERQDGVCNLCKKPMLDFGTGRGNSATVDHIVPRSKGGTNKMTNLQILCASCNRKKADSFDCYNGHSYHIVRILRSIEESTTQQVCEAAVYQKGADLIEEQIKRIRELEALVDSYKMMSFPGKEAS